MPTEYTVIGENRDDESQLLVMGADGRYYSYVPARELIAPVELDETWIIGDDDNLDTPDGDEVSALERI